MMIGDDIEENQMHDQKIYDGFNWLTRSIRDPEKLNIQTEFFYDKSGFITKEINPSGFIQRNYYDLRKRKRFEIKMIDNKTFSAIEWQYTDTNKIKNKRIYLTKFASDLISDETSLNQLPEILHIDKNSAYWMCAILDNYIDTVFEYLIPILLDLLLIFLIVTVDQRPVTLQRRADQ